MKMASAVRTGGKGSVRRLAPELWMEDGQCFFFLAYGLGECNNPSGIGATGRRRPCTKQLQPTIKGCRTL